MQVNKTDINKQYFNELFFDKKEKKYYSSNTRTF